MRFAIAQLRKLKMPYSYEEEIDLEDELCGFEDIISSSKAKVKGIITEISNERYLIKMDISIILTVESAISLKPISLPINSTTEEIYAKISEDDEDINIIDGQTIDTKDAIVTQILCEKPMRTVGEDECFLSEEEDEEDEEKINPAFASLSDLLK